MQENALKGIDETEDSPIGAQIEERKREREREGEDVPSWQYRGTSESAKAHKREAEGDSSSSSSSAALPVPEPAKTRRRSSVKTTTTTMGSKVVSRKTATTKKAASASSSTKGGGTSTKAKAKAKVSSSKQQAASAQVSNRFLASQKYSDEATRNESKQTRSTSGLMVPTAADRARARGSGGRRVTTAAQSRKESVRIKVTLPAPSSIEASPDNMMSGVAPRVNGRGNERL